MTESELLRKIRSGDEIAFVELYKRWQNAVLSFAYQMTGSRSMAEDITQDVFLLLIRKDLDFDPSRGSFSAFLLGVARNLALRALRKNFRQLRLLNLFQKPEGEPSTTRTALVDLTDHQLSDALRKCILSLPPHYREVVILCDLQELTYQEAASATGIEVGTVRSRLHRGRELLAQKMQLTSEFRKKGGNPYELHAFQK